MSETKLDRQKAHERGLFWIAARTGMLYGFIFAIPGIVVGTLLGNWLASHL